MNVAPFPRPVRCMSSPPAERSSATPRVACSAATWHLDRGLVNLSVWNGDRCTETFRLSLGDAAQFVAFLVGGLSDATTRLLHAVATPTPMVTVDGRVAWTRRINSGRARPATWIAPGDHRSASSCAGERRPVSGCRQAWTATDSRSAPGAARSAVVASESGMSSHAASARATWIRAVAMLDAMPEPARTMARAWSR